MRTRSRARLLVGALVCSALLAVVCLGWYAASPAARQPDAVGAGEAPGGIAVFAGAHSSATLSAAPTALSAAPAALNAVPSAQPPVIVSAPLPATTPANAPNIPPTAPPSPGAPEADPRRAQITATFAGRVPTQWGEDIDGVLTKLDTDKKQIALTFDACGWGRGAGYDRALIDGLRDEGVPATLFLSGKWIEENPQTAEQLAADPLFEIENHGYRHCPLSVTGRSQYGIRGTANAAEVYDEIERNARTIERLTGVRPRFFRSGTAYYDDVSVGIARELGYTIAGYTISGDEGAQLSARRIAGKCKKPPNGAILLFHMNHPEGETADGALHVVRRLRESGYELIRLDAFS